MRLTSWNIAIRSLRARKCLADMTARMWAYMEEGDTENALCVRKKAISLLGLIRTAERWRPTIKDGYRSVNIADYSDVTTPVPYYQSFQWANGMVANPPFLSFGGTEGFVNAILQANRCFIPDNDDEVQFSAVKVNNLAYKVSITSKEPVTSLGSDGSIGVQTGAVQVTPVSEEEFSDAQPLCLSDAQILAVVGKMDELCDCKC